MASSIGGAENAAYFAYPHRGIEDQEKDDGTKEEGVPGPEGGLGRNRGCRLEKDVSSPKSFDDVQRTHAQRSLPTPIAVAARPHASNTRPSEPTAGTDDGANTCHVNWVLAVSVPSLTVTVTA